MEADTFNVQGIISKLKNKLANNKLSREGLLNEIMEFVVNPDAEMLANSRSETIFANNCGISSACEMQCIPCAGIQIPRPCRDPVGPNDEIDNPCNNQRFCRVDSEEEEEEEEEECDDEEEEDEECEDEEEVEEEEEEPDPCKRPCRDVPEVECDEEEEDEEDEEEEEEEEEEDNNEKCKEDKIEKGELVAVEAEKKPEDDGYLAEEELEQICSKYRGYDKKAQCREQICKRKRLEEKAKKEAEEKAKKDAECEEDLEVDPCEAEAAQEEEDVCEANAEDLDCSCICLDDSGSESEYHSGDLKPRFESETKTSRSRSREKSPKGDYMMYRSNRIKSDTSDCAFETKPRSPKRRSVSPKSAMYFGEVEKPVVVQRKRSVSKERKENDYYTGYPCSPTNLSGKARVKDSLAPSVKKSNESLNYMEKFSSYSNRNNNNDDDDDDDTTEGDGDASNVEIDEVVVVGDESGNKVDDVVRCDGEGDSVLAFFEEDGPQDDYHKENESQVSETSSQLSNEDPYENNNVLEALILGESKCVNTSYNAFLTPEDSENEGCYHSSEKNCAGFWSGWSNEQADPSNQNEVDYTESLKHMSESSDEETYCRTPPAGGKIFENSYQVSNSDDEIYFTRDPDDKETYLFAEEAPNVLEGAFKLSMKEMSPIVTLLSHDRNSPMSGFLDFSTLTDATTATDTRRQSGDSELCVKRLSECSPVLEDHVENPESSGGMTLASFTVAHCLRIFESLKKKALGQDDTETENSEASKMPVRSAPNASISASSLSFVEPVNFRKSIGGTTDRSKYYKRESHSAQRKSPTENSVIKEVHIVESPATEDAQTEVLKANQMLKEDIKASKCNSGKLNKSPVWKSNRFKRSPKRSSLRPAQVATVDSVFFGSLQESLSFNKPDKTEKPKQPATEKKIAKSSSEPNKLVEKEDYEGFGSVKSQRSPARGESGENPPKNFSFCQFHKKCGEKKEFKRAKEKMDATKLTVKKLDSEENHKHGVQNVQKNYKPVDEPEMKNKEEKTSGVNEYGDSSKGFQKIIENKQFLVGLQKYIGNTIRNQPSADKEPNGNNKILSKGHERSRSTHSWKVSSRSSVSDAYRTNGQKLTQYKRIKDKAQQQRRNSPTLIPPSSNSGREEFMERIMPLEFCDGYVSSKGYPVQNVSYTLPQEAGNVASDGAPLNDTKWWSHMGAVNIVHTQELHRDMKQGNSLIQEIIELATNGQSLNTAQNIQTVAGYSGDSKNQDIEAGSRCENPSGDGLQVDTSGGDTQGERGDTDVIGDTEIFISETQALTQLQTMLQSDGKKPTLPFENESTSQDSAGDYYDQLHPESNEKPEGIEPNEKWVWRASKTVPRAQNCGFEVEMPTPDDESPRRRLCVKRSPILALTRNVSFPTQHSPSKNRNDEEANNNKSVDNYLSLDGSEGRTTNSPNSNTLSVKSRSKAPPSEHDLSLQEKANSPQTKASENAEFEEETQGATALGTNRKVSKWVQMRSKKNENKEKEKKLEERQDMSSSVDYIPEFTTTENDIRLSENDIKLATFQQHDRKENDSSYAKKKRLTSNERDDGKHHKQFVSRPRWKSPQPQEPTRQQWVLSKNKQDHHHDTSASEDGFTPASRGHTQRDSHGKGRNETSRSTPYQAPEIIKTYTPYKAHTNSANSRPKPSSYRMRSSASDDRISREISKELALKIAKKREEFIKKASTKYASSTRAMSGKVKEDSRGSRSEHSTSQKEESRVLRHDYSTTQVKEENRSSKTERTSASQRKIRTSTSKENFQKSFATTINKRTSAFNAKKSEMSKKNKKNEKQDVVTDKEADEDNIVEETTSTRGNYTKHGLKSFKVESSKSTNSAVNIKEFNPGRGFEHRTIAQSGSVADNISRALNNDPSRVAAYQSYTSFDPEKVLRQQRNQAVSKNTSVIDYSTRYGNKEEVASNHRPFRSPPNLWYSDVDPVDTKTEPRRSENQDMSYFEPGSPNYSNQQRLKAKKQDSNTKLSETDHSYMSYNEYSAFRGSLNTHEPRPRSEKISVPQVNHYMISKSQKAVDSAEVIPPSSFKISSTYVPPSILTSTTSKSAGTAAKSSGSAAQLKKSGSTTHLKGILSKNNSKDKPSANSATKTASPTQVRKVGSATQIKPNIKPSRPKPSQQQPTQNNQKSKSTTAVEELPVPPIPTSPEIIVEEVSFPEKPKTQTSPSVGILSRIFSTFSRQTKQSPKLEETKNSKSKSEENFPKSADKLIKKSENKKKNQFTHGKSGRAENVNHNALPLGHSTEGLGMGEPEGIYLLQTDKHFQISEFQSGQVKNLNSEAKVNQLNEDKTDSAEQFLPSKDYMANINWNADTYLAERKRKKAEILENERKKKELEKQEKFLREALMKMQQKQQAAKPPPAPPVLEDDQIALIEEARRNDPKGPIYRWKKCKESLEGSSLAELNSTLTTLLEWNIVACSVLFLLVVAGFVPGFLPNLLACPIPSAWKGFSTYFLVPLGIDVMIYKWFEPSKMSLWSIFHFGAKEPSKGVFYSFVYNLVLALLKAIVYFIGYVVVPILSLPFLIIGPFLSAINTAIMCTTKTVFASVYTLFTNLTGLSIMRSTGAPIVNPTEPYAAANAEMPGSNEIGDDYVADVTTKLHHLRKHGSFLFYFGFDHPKPECNFSYLTGAFLWLTGRYPKECN